ncbi:MAG: helix-turn-helix transcriptional regulator [Defluviitaleaceae bacterium]|nr:helix-turn-helix transcriptional regulator [Defluviitaleaceae bacterium]
MKTNQLLSQNIKNFRKSLAMTQEEFALEIGVEAQHISAIERGTRGISLEKLVELCRKYNLKMDDLLSIEASDCSLKEKWIEDILGYLRGMDVVQVGVLRRMFRGMKV